MRRRPSWRWGDRGMPRLAIPARVCYTGRTAGGHSLPAPQTKGSDTMHNELTEQDLEMMRKELDHRKLELMPELIEEVKRTRAFGDLSENFEYKAAKQAQNRNRSRIRYLERMIKNARVIEDTAAADEVGLFDKVELYFEDDGETDTIQVVTSVRCDPLQGRISRDAPLGRAVLGKKQGDRVRVTTEDGDSYTVVVRSIEKGQDDGTGTIL